MFMISNNNEIFTDYADACKTLPRRKAYNIPIAEVFEIIKDIDIECDLCRDLPGPLCINNKEIFMNFPTYSNDNAHMHAQAFFNKGTDVRSMLLRDINHKNYDKRLLAILLMLAKVSPAIKQKLNESFVCDNKEQTGRRRKKKCLKGSAAKKI